MWEFLARQLPKEAGRKLGGRFFNDEANGPEAYADRIKRDFHLQDYADAWDLYDSDRAYWERYYGAPSRPDRNKEFIRDSAAEAGVPSRNNVFEYGYPESNSARPSTGVAPPAVPFVPTNRFLAPDRSQSFDDRFGSWGSVPAGRFGETGTQSSAGNQPGRYLSRRIANQASASIPDAGAADRQDSFGNRFGNWISSAEGITPRNPNLPAPPPEPGQPLGIFSGQPMPLWTTPLPLEQLFNKANVTGDGNWFTRPAGIAPENPDQPVPPGGLLGLFLSGQR